VVSRDSMKKPTATSQGSSRLAVAVSGFSSSGTGQRRIDDGLRLGDQAA